MDNSTGTPVQKARMLKKAWKKLPIKLVPEGSMSVRRDYQPTALPAVITAVFTFFNGRDEAIIQIVMIVKLSSDGDQVYFNDVWEQKPKQSSND